MMKRIISTIIFTFVILLAGKNSYANMPMPNAFNNIQATLKNVENQMQGIEKEYTKVKNVYMNAKEKVNDAKEKVNEVTEKADKAAKAIKNPKEAMTIALASMAGALTAVALADSVMKEFVETKDITPEQYQKKVEKDRQRQNDRVALLYGTALAHRKKLLKEEESEPVEASSVNDVLRRTNAKVKEIVDRLAYMQMLEAMTDELDYQQKLISFRTSEKGAE